MSILCRTLTVLALHCFGHVGMAAEGPCEDIIPARVRIQFAGQAVQEAILSGRPAAGLRLLDAADGEVLWSAGAGPGVTQAFPLMNAAFGASLSVLDLDGDGLHDRLYAGDRSGRLWRLDFHAGAPAERWATGGVFADFGAPETARGFVAAPDVALIAMGATAWLSIAIGTTTLGEGLPSNRFYVLRDSLERRRPVAGAAGSQSVLRETDLQRVEAPLAMRDLSGPGYFIPLGTSQVLASSLTLDGSIHFTVVETTRRLGGGCPADALAAEPALLSISVIRAIDGAVTQDVNDDGRVSQDDLRVSLPRRLLSNAGVELTAAHADTPANRLVCSVDGLPVEGCGLDISPHRTYWRREDAD